MGFNVAGAGDSQYVLLNNQPLAGTSFADKAALAGTSYNYYVTAVSTLFVESVRSSAASASTDPAVNVPPAAQILSPLAFSGAAASFAHGAVQDGRLQTLTPIMASITDPSGLLGGWKLSLHPLDVENADGALDTVLAQQSATAVGSSDAKGQRIFTLDPSLFPNGNYDLVLQPLNASLAAIGIPASVEVSLYSQAKTGNLTLPI